MKRCVICSEVKPKDQFAKDKIRSDGLNNKCKECIRQKYIAKYQKKWANSHYQTDGISGTWTKWGGKRLSVIQEAVRDFWSCQSCGKQEPDILSPYKYEYPEQEWIRVCAICFENGCIILRQRIRI